MTKKNNRKGFTIVELVIVIAVIAILATVLVPTISGVVQDAQEAAALQEARTVYTNYVLENIEEGSKEDLVIKLDDDVFVVVQGGTVLETVYENAATAGAVVRFIAGEGENKEYRYWQIDASNDPTSATETFLSNIE